MKAERIPAWYIPSFAYVTPEWLLEQGLRGLVSDIDNTLASYAEPEPPVSVTEWVKRLTDAGIRLSFASNNNEKRVETFCRPLGLPFVAKAGKPGTAGVLRAVSFLELPPDRVGFLGDQIFTDVTAANRAGLVSILVRPLTLSNPLFRLRYQFEKPYIRCARKCINE